MQFNQVGDMNGPEGIKGNVPMANIIVAVVPFMDDFILD